MDSKAEKFIRTWMAENDILGDFSRVGGRKAEETVERCVKDARAAGISLTHFLDALDRRQENARHTIREVDVSGSRV